MSGNFNNLHSKLQQQEQTILKLSEDSFIPHSAQTNFSLNASESVMETNKYKTLATEMETVCDTFRKAAKKAIYAVAKLEIENTKKQTSDIFVKTAKHVAHLVILKNNAVLQHTDVELATLAIEKHGSGLTKYSCLKLLDVLNAISHPTPYSGSAFLEEKKEALAPLISTFSILMVAAFMDSWDKQLDCYKMQAIERAMANHVKDVLDGTATQQAAATMDAEPTADPALLKDIIKKQVDSQQRLLQNQINELKQKLSCSLQPVDTTSKPAKNTNRGLLPKHPTAPRQQTKSHWRCLSNQP